MKLPGHAVRTGPVGRDPAHSAGLSGHIPVRLNNLTKKFPPDSDEIEKGLQKIATPFLFVHG